MPILNSIVSHPDAGQGCTVKDQKSNTIPPDIIEHAIQKLSAVSSGTEDLLSLYIPPSRTVGEVLEYLDPESGVWQHGAGTGRDGPGSPDLSGLRTLLKKFRTIPETGLAIFCSADGRVCEVLQPPVPVKDFFLRVSTQFDLGSLRTRAAGDTGGLILLDLGQAFWALSRGGKPVQISRIESAVPAKHHKGGQSAARFQRLRKIAAHGFYTRVGEHAGAGLLAGTGNGEELAYVLIGGHPGAAADLAAGTYLPAAIRQKILGSVEQDEISEGGIGLLAAKGQELFRARKNEEDLRLAAAFLDELARAGGLAVAGEAGVRKGLLAGSVKILFLSSTLRTAGARVTCSICGDADERNFRLGPDESVSGILAHSCRACDAPLIGDPAIDITEDLGRLATGSGAWTIIVSDNSRDGKRFMEKTGGIGALLRFRPGA